jgi:universal stress protein A
MQEIKRILVPLDFSDVSRAALSMGLQLAESHDAKLYVLHVVKDLAKELQKRLVSAPNDTVIEDGIQDGERNILDAVQLEYSRAKEAGSPLSVVPLNMHVTGGDWLEACLQLVEDDDIDLVVSGTHGGKGLKGWLLGSTTEQLVRKSSCSVFVVKPQGFPYLRD